MDSRKRRSLARSARATFRRASVPSPTATGGTTVTVNNVAPTATANSYGTTQAIAVSGNVITDNGFVGVDSDPAGANDPLAVSAYTQPANGALVLQADGTFRYTPSTTFYGTDSFSYTITDGDLGYSTATVTIVVSAVVSLTLTPMMASRILKHNPKSQQGRFYQASERVFEGMIAFYGRTLKVVLRYQTQCWMVPVVRSSAPAK